MKDGWHIVCGYSVYVEDGKILRGTSGKGNSMTTTYPYRRSRYGGWDNESGVTVNAFRAAYRRDNMRMF